MPFTLFGLILCGLWQILEGLRLYRHGRQGSEMKPQKQVAALALLSSTALFPIIILSPFTGNIIPLLGNFAAFYAFFGTGVLILLAMAYEGRSVRIARPKNSRIRK